MSLTEEQLIQRQSYNLDIKIFKTKQVIRQFYDKNDGQVYISYSGGKDSEVMRHLVKELYPDVKAVFVDTGTEHKTREHANKKADVVIRPKKTMYEVWKKYGIPFPSKQQANYLYKINNTKSDYLKSRLMTGIMKDGSKTMFKLSKKWKPLLDTDFKFSERCCYYLKKEPLKRYGKESGCKPFIGTMASDGFERKKMYKQHGCIDIKRDYCYPLGFWTEQDILKYLKSNNIEYCDAYGDIIENNGYFKTTKAKRTGCEGCCFGVHLEKSPNRFERMAKEDPQRHNAILNVWLDGSIGKIMKMYNIPTGEDK